MPNSNFVVVVFSYNRGRFLRNCVSSIERHASDARLIVYDDLSDDAETRKVLEEIGQKHEVLQPSADSNHNKLGGLYGNMQSVYEHLGDDDIMCCVQDDMQFVRDISADDRQAIEAFFDNNTNAGFLHPCFMKGHQRQRYHDTTRYNEEQQVYFRESNDRRAGEYYSDIFIASIKRLRDKQWKFLGKEKLINAQASEVFDRMGFLPHPFVHWLPCVPSHRHKGKTWALKIAEKRSGVGFYPFDTKQASDWQGFFQRDVNAQFPIAEDFLTTTPVAPVNPWIYHPMQDVPRWIDLAHKFQARVLKR